MTNPPQETIMYRKKSQVEIEALPSAKQFRVVSEMEDGHHHMRLTMVVDHPTMRIDDLSIEMPGIPDPICRQAVDSLRPLIGKNAGPGIMREIKAGWAPHGCTHLAELFRAACYCLPQAQSGRGREDLEAMFPGLTEEQLYRIFLWFRPDLENSCVRYADGSPFMAQVRAAELPPGAAKLKAAIRKPPED